MTVSQGLAVLVFVVVFILIAIEAIHRTYAALLGALIFVLIGAVRAEDILARDFIDIEILAVVLGSSSLYGGPRGPGCSSFSRSRS
jgi:Na+/H+ antiporter NhaD/arsenite permease-like protein